LGNTVLLDSCDIRRAGLRRRPYKPTDSSPAFKLREEANPPTSRVYARRWLYRIQAIFVDGLVARRRSTEVNRVHSAERRTLACGCCYRCVTVGRASIFTDPFQCSAI